MSFKIKILPIALCICFSIEAMAQLSQKPFLQKSNALLGLSYSRMANDPIYDQDLLRFQFGYIYNIYEQGKLGFDIGALYTVKGGKSFFEDNYQTFGYISVPFQLRYPVSSGFQFGLGLRPSFLLFNETRHRGSKFLYKPSPFPRYPSNNDVSIAPFIELNLTQRVKLNITGSYSVGSSTDENADLNFLTFSAGLKFNFGKTIERFENLVYKSREKDLKLLDVQNGSVVVVLNKKEGLAEYLRQQGQQEKADEVLEDARMTNAELVEAFNNKFTFCQVWFVYNTQLTAVCAGDSTQKAFSTSYEQVPFKQVAQREYVFFYPGDIYLNLQSFSGDGYYFQDARCNKLDEPFPSSTALQQRGKTMNQLVFGLDKRLKNRAEQISSKPYVN